MPEKSDIPSQELNTVTLTPQELEKVIAENKGNILSLDITTLSTENAEILAKWKGKILRFDNLDKLSPEAAEVLAKWKGNILRLDGLDILSPETAKALAKWKGKNLDFNALDILSPETAKALAEWKGYNLSFSGLTALSPETAEALAKWKGGILCLDGLTTLSPETAEILAKWKGYILGLSGLNIISVSAADSLKGARFSVEAPYSLDHYNCTDDIEESVYNYEGVYETIKKLAPEWQPFFKNYPNFKGIVDEEGTELTNYLKENNVPNPEFFQNLNAKTDIRPLADEALVFFETLPSCSGSEAFKEQFESKTLKPFEQDSKFLEIYKDEVIQGMADHLSRIVQGGKESLQKQSDEMRRGRVAFLQERLEDPAIKERAKKKFRKDLKNLPSAEVQQSSSETDARVGKAEALLQKFESLHFIRPGKSGFKLASRNVKELTLGDECSDCTSASIGGMNFWTVPTWLTDPGFNFLLQYDKKGQLAHKFGLVWETTPKGEIILTMDSMEVGNSQKPKGGMYEGVANEAKEGKLMAEAMAFVRAWAGDMGVNPDNLYAATFSNTGTMELDQKYPKKSIQISKLGALAAVENILEKHNPKGAKKPKIYLQSYQVGVGEAAPIGGNQPQNIEVGDPLEDFGKVEKAFTAYLESADPEFPDAKKVKALLELASENPDEAARRMEIFWVMEAKEEAKKALSLENDVINPNTKTKTVRRERIDSFLNSRGHSLKVYFNALLGKSEVARGKFVQANLFHLVAKKKNGAELLSDNEDEDEDTGDNEDDEVEVDGE